MIFFFNLTNLKPGDGFDAVEHDQARDAFRIGRRVDHRHPAAHRVTDLKINLQSDSRGHLEKKLISGLNSESAYFCP